MTVTSPLRQASGAGLYPPPDVLVVEGWVNDDGVRGAIAELKKRDYQVVITTDQPLGRGYYLSRYKNFAYLTAATFIAFGSDPQSHRSFRSCFA